MTKQYKAVGIFPTRRETETALRDLIKQHGFPIDNVSVIAQHQERGGINDLDALDDEIIEHSNNSSTGVATGVVTGGTLGGLTGLLVGLGTIAIPGIGPIMLAGATATAIATTVAGGAIGAATGSLVGALIGLGIPKDRAKAYRAMVAEGGFLVIVEGAIEEVQMAEEILSQHGIDEWEVYDALETDTLETEAKNHRLRIMGAFPDLYQTKTALIDLINIGYSLSQVTLFINDGDRHDWFPNLKVCDSLDYSFSLIPEAKQLFFQDCFDLGQYIVVVEGTESEICRAETILRQHQIEGFYTLNPHDRELPIDNPSATNFRPLVISDRN